MNQIEYFMNHNARLHMKLLSAKTKEEKKVIKDRIKLCELELDALEIEEHEVIE